MKRLIVVIFFCGTALSLLSQTDTTSWKHFLPRHEVQIGIGDPFFSSVYAGRINWGTSLMDYDYPAIQPNQWFEPDTYRGATFASGAVSVSYMFRIQKWLWLGGTFSYSGFYNEVFDRVSNQKVDYRDSHFISIIPTVRFSWLNKKYLTLYSGVGVGIATVFEKTNNELTFSPIVPHLTAVGIHAGKNWYGFFEIGLGVKGIVSTGFGYHFNCKNN